MGLMRVIVTIKTRFSHNLYPFLTPKERRVRIASNLRWSPSLIPTTKETRRIILCWLISKWVIVDILNANFLKTNRSFYLKRVGGKNKKRERKKEIAKKIYIKTYTSTQKKEKV